MIGALWPAHGQKLSMVRRRAVLGLAVLAATGTALASGANAWAAAPGEGEIRAAGSAQSIPGSYIVVLKDSAAIRSQSVDSSAGTLTSKFGGKVKTRFQAAFRGFSVTEMTDEQAKRLAADPAVDFVQRNGVFSKTDVQDPAIWNLDRIDQRQSGNFHRYQYPNTATSVRAYVIDTGIDTSHTHFGGRATWGVNTTGDGANYDCNGHGTHVAGTLGGTQYGVAKGVQLIAVKVLGCDGSGSSEGVAAGIEWMMANVTKPAVANMSLGAGGTDTIVNNAVKAAVAAGITVSVSAGNGDQFGNPLPACGQSPAMVNEAIAVSATESDDYKASWANYGPCVDIFAPGVDILSSVPYNGWASGDGTSMAAPHVAGAAALILQAHPTYTPAQVRQVLITSATGGAVHEPGDGSPNLLLYVRNVEPPAIASSTVSLYNPRFGTTEVYARTAENKIVYAYYSGRWSEWLDLGGNVVGEPAVLYNPRFGTTEVYARTSTNTIAYRYYSNGWSAWNDLGGNIAGDPAVLYNPRFGTTEVYARTAENKLAYRYFSNGWSAWNDLQGNLASDPGVLYNPRFGTTEAYVRTADNRIQYRYFSNGWSSWIDLEGTNAGDPAVLYNPRFGTTEVYTRTAANKLAYRYYSNGWSGWNDLAGDVASDPAVLYNPRFGTTEAYVRTSTNKMQYRYFSNGWSGWNDLAGSVAGNPSLIFNPQYSSTEVYSRTQNSHANYRYFANGWSGWIDLSL